MAENQRNSIWFVLILILLGFLLFPLVHRILNPQIAFSSQSVEVLFKESIMRISPTQGDVLEVASLESFDTFTRRDTKSLFDNLVYLGTTVSEIKVKVTYRYHVLLSDEWQIELKDKELWVTPPAIRATLPPAIHTDQMEKRSEAGWLRFNAQENLDKLESSLTPNLAAMALSPTKTLLVKEAARQSLEKFVRTWVLSQATWQESQVNTIRISYPGETIAPQ